MENRQITSWKQFSREVRSRGCRLLKRLDDFPDSILVTGCQRSGTTMLARAIMQSPELVNYEAVAQELDGALILSGWADHTPRGRYCFQTTYLDACFPEYYEHREGYRTIWILRNPYSVIHSLLYNFPAWTLDEIFRTCGVTALTGVEKWMYLMLGAPGVSHLQRAYFAYNGKGARYLMRDRFDREKLMFVDCNGFIELRGITRLRRACYLYAAKISQLLELTQWLGPDRMMVVDYDDLTTQSETVLSGVFGFVQLEYRPEYVRGVHAGSLDKWKNLSAHEIATVTSLCEPIYLEARKLAVS